MGRKQRRRETDRERERERGRRRRRRRGGERERWCFVRFRGRRRWTFFELMTKREEETEEEDDQHFFPKKETQKGKNERRNQRRKKKKTRPCAFLPFCFFWGTTTLFSFRGLVVKKTHYCRCSLLHECDAKHRSRRHNICNVFTRKTREC